MGLPPLFDLGSTLDLRLVRKISWVKMELEDEQFREMAAVQSLAEGFCKFWVILWVSL